MALGDVNDIERLRKINAALVSRVERSMDQQGNAFSLFQTAILLGNRVRMRTEEHCSRSCGGWSSPTSN